MDDAKIVDLYWLRSEQAISETAAKYGNYLFRIADRMLCSREGAAECVNDTYLGAWNAMPPHRPTQLATFLGKIARRIALSMIRRDTRQKRGGAQTALVYEELADCLSDGGAEHALESVALREVLERFLASLSARERSVFLSRYWYFASVAEISRCSGYTQSKVASMLFRLRQRLREYLSREGY